MMALVLGFSREIGLIIYIYVYVYALICVYTCTYIHSGEFGEGKRESNIMRL